MTDQEKVYFEALTKDRSEIADVLDRRSVRGYKDSVVEKYSDQAHFIYELLQNADDVHATRVRFVLEKDRLIFAHNGSRHFSVTDPFNEDADSENGAIGDINSITSIANSNKAGASIGKFGVGFKAVFQYTSTPYIYDPEFRFKIERFIVPIMLDEDFPGRDEDETLFVFPFDHKERNAVRAYVDIVDKLKNLKYPLLFLTHLKEIDLKFDFADITGTYGKEITETVQFGDTEAEKIILGQYRLGGQSDVNLWLFSRKDDYGRRYSAGFFMDEKGKLMAVNEPAFCFFQTKEVTHLNFIVHAPFLLTDSREGIRAGVDHNDEMIRLLSKLAADSLIYLKNIGEKNGQRLVDDSIISIIPFNSANFSDISDRSRVSFLPFYTAIKKKFKDSIIIPTKDGYVSSEDAYWADVPQLTQIISDSQLADIVENDNAKWAFPSIGRFITQQYNRNLYDYLDDLIRTNINEDVIINGRSREFHYSRIAGERRSLENIKGITADFIESQPTEWLHRFYGWISDTNHRTEMIRKKKIFLDQDRKAVAAFDESGQLILFLPVEGMKGYSVVHPELLENDATRAFVEKIGVKEPSLRDRIYNIVLPQYVDGAEFDTDPHFRMFFEYYNESTAAEAEDLLEIIRKYSFLVFLRDGVICRSKASDLYFPDEGLRKYFESRPETRFIDIDRYRRIVGIGREGSLNVFLNRLGVKSVPGFKTTITEGQNYKCSEVCLEGLEEIIGEITSEKDKDRSVFLWGQLCALIIKRVLDPSVMKKTVQTRHNRRYSFKTSYEASYMATMMRTEKWLVNVQGEFVSASEVFTEDLSEIYDQNAEGASELISMLEINEAPKEELGDDSNLTESQKEKIALADRLREFGINDDVDLEALKEFLQMREAKKKSEEAKKDLSLMKANYVTWNEDERNHHEKAAGNKEYDRYEKYPKMVQSCNDSEEDDGAKLDAEVDALLAKNEKEVTEKERKISSTRSNVIKDIAKRTRDRGTARSEGKTFDAEEPDQDEYMPPVIDYSRKIEKAKEKSAAEIEKIAHYEELQAKALQAERYSYAWFKTLLEMEAINQDETDGNSKEVSISFAKVERESGTKRTLVLKYPNRYIPQFMEDLADIPLVLHMADQMKTVAIEVANIRSYTLRVKLKNGSDIEGINLESVTSATIDAKSPVFLLEELRKQFLELGMAEDFNLQRNLCENIEFVFGPPGTGKTTHLARNVLIPMMNGGEACKVLVLTPTNKAADVLVRRIMEVSGEDKEYERWLVRFGATGDEEIEQSPVFRDKTFDIRTLPKNVTVTTIARFPYDFFMPQDTRIYLNGINWDYIIIDEASMIPLASIVYPLYKKTPRKFIIAGDPFQIEPITSVNLWKNENIYTMVHLDSFVRPSTYPHYYKVELLTTQYRSIPEIGSIFSHFAYGGILKHHRLSGTQRNLNIGGEMDIRTLNIIKFPISRYESIYRSKRLQHSSSYQIYSALFTYEYVTFLSGIIAKNNPEEMFRIGVIAPYRAQADMIDKLLAAEKLPAQVDVQVGTIHGFQGDECDIIFAVFNTPPTISSSGEMFLNKKSIVNVSISRAKDYLFIVMPDDNTENISNLRLVNCVEKLIKKTDSWKEFLSSDLEELMFGDPKYLENNAFSTSHQNVNVYGLPEKCYEVRTEDAAVDVQVHKPSKDLVDDTKI